MAKKGSVTVFLALMLSLMVSLVSAGIQSTRMAAARTQILNSVDIGLYSLFGHYDKTLLKEYDLFLLDGSCGGGTLRMASVYDNFEAYVTPILKQNSQKLSLSQGGLTGYQLVTDQSGEVFFQQVVKYMKETLGSQGVQLLLEKMQERKERTQKAEEEGQKSENKNALESYDSEIQKAEQNSEEKKEQIEQEVAEGAAETETLPAVPTEEVTNPIPVIKKIRKMGVLELLVPAGKEISDYTMDRSSMVSKRALQKGMALDHSLSSDSSVTAQLLYQQYLVNKFGNFQNPSTVGPKYPLEYILCGKGSDRENLKAVVNKLLLVREGINISCLMTDAAKRAQVKALALAIASTFLVPPAAIAIEGALLLCWSFAESVLDVRELLAGGKVPLVKNAKNWQLSLEKLPYLLENMDSSRKTDTNGLSYEDYLQIFLMAASKNSKVQRGMDMVEVFVRTKEGKENFQLDSCITALEAFVDVKANKKKTFQVIRKYAYD